MSEEIQNYDPKVVANMIRSLEEEMKGAGKKYLIVSIERGDSLALGQTIIDVDREIRRTVTMFEMGALEADTVTRELSTHRGTQAYSLAVAMDRETPPSTESTRSTSRDSKERWVKPVDPSRGATRLIAFEPGSGHFLFEVVGAAMGVLTTVPLSAILNLSALMQGGRWLGARVKVFRTRNTNLKIEDALKVAAANDGDIQSMLGKPDHTFDLGPIIEATRIKGRNTEVTFTQAPDGSMTAHVVCIESFE